MKKFFLVAWLLSSLVNDCFAVGRADEYQLEEITVTAHKTEKSLQDIPIAINTLDSRQLNAIGIDSLLDLATGVVPSLKIMPLGNTPSNLTIGIRGNSPLDPGEITRDGSVAVYIDEVYMTRPQALGMQLVDMERVEVLKGPQGTLFGRNTIGGAVSLIPKKPTGKFGVTQNITMGNFNALKSITRINLPTLSGLSAKFNYIYSERDGWVDNTIRDQPDDNHSVKNQSDYNEYKKQGGRVELNYNYSDTLSVDYSYDHSDTETAQIYFQFYKDIPGVFGQEPDRMHRTRLPVVPLSPTTVEQYGHAIKIKYHLSDEVAIKSISAYRELEEDSNNNYAGVLYFNGLNDASTLDHYQLSQEIQIVGSNEQSEWAAGIYFLKEDATKVVSDTFTLDIFGGLTGQPLTIITPPTSFNVFSNANIPLRTVDSKAESFAVYAQTTVDIIADTLRLTIGGRYTEDDKKAKRIENDIRNTSIDDNSFDSQIAAEYLITDAVTSYLKYSTAYKSGGVNTRSFSFQPFSKETATTYEAGVKSELWGRRMRLNAALFLTEYDDAQLDFVDPGDPTVVETINAKNPADVSGAEVDLMIMPTHKLTLNLIYNYLDADMPLQPNPLDPNNTLKVFHIAFTPNHSGYLGVNYHFDPFSFGSLQAHINITSTDKYKYGSFGEQREDGYTLFNARLTLNNISVNGYNNESNLSLSIWGRNLADEEYIINSFPVSDPPITVGQAFGDPRTYGIDLKYIF